MCTNGKCLFCIPVEVGSLIFGILSSIIHAVCMITAVVLLIYGNFFIERGFKQIVRRAEYDSRGYVNDIMINAGLKEEDPREDIIYALEDAKFIGSVTFNILMAVLMLFSVISFTFSVLLCNGAAQRKPGQVRAYFIYGVVIAVFGTTGAIILCMADGGVGIMALILCIIYYLILVMVHQTYSKLNSGIVYNDHKRLVEDVSMT